MKETLNDIMNERGKNWLERVKEHCTQLNCLFGWLQQEKASSLYKYYNEIVLYGFIFVNDEIRERERALRRRSP